MISWSNNYLRLLIGHICVTENEQFIDGVQRAHDSEVFSTIEAEGLRRLLLRAFSLKRKGHSISAIEQYICESSTEMELEWDEMMDTFESENSSAIKILDTLEDMVKRNMTYNTVSTIVDMAKQDNWQDNITLVEKELIQYFLNLQTVNESHEAVITPEFSEGDWSEPPAESEKVPTPLTHLNEFINGGIGKGELWLVVGPQNGGKSMWLAAAAAEAALEGHHVVIFTLEMSAVKYQNRVLANISQIPIAFLHEQRQTAIKRVKKAMAESGGSIHIKEFATGVATTAHFENYMSVLRARGIDPTCVITDYADLMRSHSGKNVSDHKSIAGLYRDLRRFCQQQNVAGWTASQSNRSGAKNFEETDETDIADSYEKMAIVDGALHIRSSKDEISRDQMRFLLTKNRDRPKVHNGAQIEIRARGIGELMSYESIGLV